MILAGTAAKQDGGGERKHETGNPDYRAAAGAAAQSAPDLEVGFPEVSDSSPVEGGRFTLWVTVANFGDGESAATTLRYYQSTDATISSADTQVGTAAVGAVEAHRISQESIRLTAPSTAGVLLRGLCGRGGG